MICIYRQICRGDIPTKIISSRGLSLLSENDLTRLKSSTQTISNFAIGFYNHLQPGAPWQTDFERRYIELEELGRGRFGVVRKCQEILTGSEVAVKFVNRKRQPREQTLREHEALSGISHPNLIHSTGLFVTATSDAIVLNL